MIRIALELLIGAVAFVVAMAAGYRGWHRRRRLLDKTGGPAGGAVAGGAAAAHPLAAGIGAGIVLLCLGASWIVPGDRFFATGQAVRVALAFVLGGFLILAGDMLVALAVVAGAYPWNDRAKAESAQARAARFRWIGDLILLLLASFLVVSSGVRFSILGIGGERAVELGSWAGPLTVLWIVAATAVVRLLDGLEGAANIVLVVAAFAIFYVTLGAGEHFLNALAVTVLGAALASLRFNFFPARLPLRGAGSAFVGFVFAVLTVLARQKTVAALLLVFPLVVLVVLVGGAMLALIERTIQPGKSDPE
jgi:UDP-GlcNAc:undecaprenyl-phosphate GlcNAc-1-phosphate transferase